MGGFDSEISANQKTFAESRFGSEAVTRLRSAFGRSKHAMLFADDERRWITGNHAAADLLSTPLDEIPWHKIDDFLPPGFEADRVWQAFIDSGSAEGWIRLIVPGHTQVPVEYSCIASVLPGRHLITYLTPDEELPEGAEILARSAAAKTGSDLLSDQPELSKREREVLELVAEGCLTREIGDKLFLSPETVKSHVQNALAKLSAHTRAHAVAISLVGGQITFQP